MEARTIGAPLRRPALDLGRIPDAEASNFHSIPTLGSLSGPAANGSGMFVWDIGPKRVEGTETKGTDPPPTTNEAPDDSFGVDPHDTVIDDSPLISAQIAEFIRSTERSPIPAPTTRATRRAGTGCPDPAEGAVALGKLTRVDHRDGDRSALDLHLVRVHLRPRRGGSGRGHPAGTPFDQIPDDWFCPVCGARKADFEPYERAQPPARQPVGTSSARLR